MLILWLKTFLGDDILVTGYSLFHLERSFLIPILCACAIIKELLNYIPGESTLQDSQVYIVSCVLHSIISLFSLCLNLLSLNKNILCKWKENQEARRIRP